MPKRADFGAASIPVPFTQPDPPLPASYALYRAFARLTMWASKSMVLGDGGWVIGSLVSFPQSPITTSVASNHPITHHHERSEHSPRIGPVVRRFAGDDHVVGVALPQPGGGDPHEAGLPLQ